MQLRIEYDSVADAAMIYLRDPIEPGSVKRGGAADLELESAAVLYEFDQQDRRDIGREQGIAHRIAGASRNMNGPGGPAPF